MDIVLHFTLLLGRARRRHASPLANEVVVALLAALTVLVLFHYGLSLVDQLRFAAALVGTNLLPGYVIGALIAPSRPSGWLVRGRVETSFGAAFVFGLGPQLAGWALAVSTGWSWMSWCPALVVTALGFTVLSRRGLGPSPRPAAYARASIPWWVIVGRALVWLVLLRSLIVQVWSGTPLHGQRMWYQDLYWHLAISSQALHHIPPNDPQSAADGALSYHWFSNAQAAAFSLSSGVDLAKISVLAWFVPVALAAMSLVYGFAKMLSDSAAVAVLAIVLFVFSPALLPLQQLDGGGITALYWLSPSHTLAVPVGLLGATLIDRVFREARRGHVGWVAVVSVGYVFCLCPGTKISLLPVLLAGLAAALIGLVIQRRSRRVSPSARGTTWRFLIALLVAGGVVLIGTMGTFGGGGGGSHLSYGATIGQLTMWKQGGGTAFSDPVTMTALMVAVLGTYLPYLLIVRVCRADAPAVWFCGGAMALALTTMFFLEHPSRSQLYFVRGFIPCAVAFLAWGAVMVWRQWPRASTAGFIAAFVCGLGWSRTAMFADVHPVEAWWIVPMALVFTVTVVVLVRLLGNPLGPSRWAATLVTACLGWGVAISASATIAEPLPPLQAATAQGTPQLSPDELNGARALAAANPHGFLMATNVHCLAITTTSHCDARGFWVAALTRSPALMGAWAYAQSARTEQGRGGYNYIHQPYADARIAQINERFFAHPDAAGAAQLRALGVRFIYADSRARPWSPEMVHFARPIWLSPTVGVFELPKPAGSSS